MKKALNFLATFLIVLLLSNFSFGQPIINKIDSIIKAKNITHPEVGISVGYIHNTEEYYTAYGKMSKESNISINKNSIFEIASITKILTSNLIAQAEIDGKLNVTDFIDSYLPKEYILQEELKHKIKISDLASHQSGLPDLDFRALIALDPQQPISHVTQETLTTLLNDCSTLIDHGEYRYSTMGYVLLGQILEEIYGKSYDAIIREYIIDPLQLTNTLTKDFNVKNRTKGYNPQSGAQEFMKWHLTASAGLLKSSASDMITFLKAVLNKETRIGKAAVITEKISYNKEGRALGLGINIMTDDRNTIYLKSGDTMGQSCIICYNRSKSWGIIILLDQRNSKMRQELWNEIYEDVLK